jgi:protein-S-isoprenylcysteine O-methyltransferase Ste14
VRLPLLLFAGVVGLVILTLGFASTYILGSGTEDSSRAWLVVVAIVTTALFLLAALVWRMGRTPRRCSNDSAKFPPKVQ